MPTLFRFLMVLGMIVGVVAGSLYVLAEYFQPEPKEISKALRNVKAHIQEDTASAPAPVPGPAPETTGSPGNPQVPVTGASPASAPVNSAAQGQNHAQ
jgi:hypothetical protein